MCPADRRGIVLRAAAGQDDRGYGELVDPTRRATSRASAYAEVAGPADLLKRDVGRTNRIVPAAACS